MPAVTVNTPFTVKVCGYLFLCVCVCVCVCVYGAIREGFLKEVTFMLGLKAKGEEERSR